MNLSRLFVVLVFAASGYSIESPSIGSCQVFPANNAWNWDISGYQVHPNSANFVQGVGPTTSLHPDFGTPAGYGIPYVVVGASQPKITVNFTAYADESDPGPYPIPLDAPIEGTASADSNSDRHVLCIDTSNKILYELANAYPQTTSWNASCGAVFNLASNVLRPAGWTSADAAGLPIFPGLVRYEEVVVKKEITHAIRMTVSKTDSSYIYPARHLASHYHNTNYPPMGLRFRLKASFDISSYPEDCQVILRALKKYGMIVADNGSNWYISGAPDDRWNDNDLNLLKQVKGSDFEAVLTVDASGNPILPQNAVIKRQLRTNRIEAISNRQIVSINNRADSQIKDENAFDMSGKVLRAKRAKACGVYYAP